MAEEYSQIEDHIHRCRECGNRVKSAQRANAAIVAAFQRPVDAREPIEIEHIKNAIFGEQTGENTVEIRQHRRARRKDWNLWMAGAAGTAAAICVGAVLLYSGIGHQEPTTAIRGHTTGKDSFTTGITSNATTPDQHGARVNIMKTQEQPGYFADVPETNRASGKIQMQAPVHVTSTNGTPVEGARVAVVAGGALLASGVTGRDGNTQKLSVSAPYDPVLTPSFNQSIPARGTVTVVAWKDGYQSVVDVNKPVLPGATELNVTMDGVSQAAQPLSVIDEGFAPLETDNFVKWVQEQVKGVAPRVQNVGGPHTNVIVRVVDESGRSVEGAKVAVVVGDSVQGLAVTSADGTIVPLDVPTDADMRAYGVGQPGQPARVIQVVIYKDGYTPYVSLYHPATAGGTTDLGVVTLQSIASQQAKGYNQAGTPFAAPNPPTAQDAEAFLQWVKSRVK
jgi:hypothetical protein